MRLVRLEAKSVELKVGLDARVVLLEKGEEPVVAGDLNPVGIDDDSLNVALEELLDERHQLGMDRRLAAAEHEDVEPPVLAREARVDVGEHLLHRHESMHAR